MDSESIAHEAEGGLHVNSRQVKIYGAKDDPPSIGSSCC